MCNAVLNPADEILREINFVFEIKFNVLIEMSRKVSDRESSDEGY